MLPVMAWGSYTQQQTNPWQNQKLKVAARGRTPGFSALSAACHSPSPSALSVPHDDHIIDVTKHRRSLSIEVS